MATQFKEVYEANCVFHYHPKLWRGRVWFLKAAFTPFKRHEEVSAKVFCVLKALMRKIYANDHGKTNSNEAAVAMTLPGSHCMLSLHATVEKNHLFLFRLCGFFCTHLMTWPNIFSCITIKGSKT